MLRALSRLSGYWLLGSWLLLAAAVLLWGRGGVDPSPPVPLPAPDTAQAIPWDSAVAQLPPAARESLQLALDTLAAIAQHPSPALAANLEQVTTAYRDAVRHLLLVALGPPLVLGLVTLAWGFGRWRYRSRPALGDQAATSSAV